MADDGGVISLPFKLAAELAMNVAIRFWQASAYCADKLIIDGLAPIFTDCGDFMASVGDALVTADAWLVEIFDIVYTLFQKEGLEGLVAEYWPGLEAFLVDPVAYILAAVGEITPDLPDWLDDPVAWFNSVLLEHFPLLYYLVFDTESEILYLIGLVFGLTPYDTQSPEFLVKAIVQRYLPGIFELIYLTPGGLWGFLLAVYSAVFESIADAVLRAAEMTLLYAWEGVRPSAPETIWLWLTGVVTEAESPALAAATVTVVGTDLYAVTDDAGQYTIRGEAAAADSYNLLVTKPGYRDTMIAGVVARDGVQATINVGMEYVVTPPERNPAPRLERLIDVYLSTAEKLVWTRAVLETKRGLPTEAFWQAQLDELLAWMQEASVDIRVAQTELRLYFGEAGVPDEYAALLEFQC
jgi:hypothetical protein